MPTCIPILIFVRNRNSQTATKPLSIHLDLNKIIALHYHDEFQSDQSDMVMYSLHASITMHCKCIEVCLEKKARVKKSQCLKVLCKFIAKGLC